VAALQQAVAALQQHSTPLESDPVTRLRSASQMRFVQGGRMA